MLLKRKAGICRRFDKNFKNIPEYAAAGKDNAGVKIFAGSKENHCGKIALTEITGGTEAIFKNL